MQYICVGLVIAAILCDVISFVFGVKRLRGDGPSGVPFFGTMLFALSMMLLYLNQSITGEFARRSVLAYGTFQIIVQIGLLYLLHLVWDYLPFTRRKSSSDDL